MIRRGSDDGTGAGGVGGRGPRGPAAVPGGAATHSLGNILGFVLKLNATGASVTSLQQQLTDLGFATYLAPEGVDGKFGPHTEAAVKAFQSASGLTSDGIVGDSTRAALTAASANGTSASGARQALVASRGPSAVPPSVSSGFPATIAGFKTSTVLIFGGIALAAAAIFLGGSGKPAFGDFFDDSGLPPVEEEDADDGDPEDELDAIPGKIVVDG